MFSSVHQIIFCMLLTALSVGTTSEYEDDMWTKNSGWSPVTDHSGDFGIDIPNTCARLGSSGTSDETASFIFFKKFIAHLFNRNSLTYDSMSDSYKRLIQFTLQPAQLEKLEQLNDPRDLDSVLTQIFAKAYEPVSTSQTGAPTVTALTVDIFKDVAKLFQTSEVQFMTLALSVLLVGWCINHRYRIGVVKLIFAGALLFGYVFTYLECNRKLELEEMLEVMELTDDQPRWYSPLLRLFRPAKDEKQAHVESLKKTTKIKLRFCRPDHVALMYWNELFLKQFELMFDKIMDTMQVFIEKLPFPFNYLGPIMLLLMLAYVIKLTFKYILSPRSWAALLHRRPSVPGATTASNRPAEIGDRISGENLKALISVLQHRPHMVVNQTLNAVSEQLTQEAVTLHGSGVQEILEQLQDTAKGTGTPHDVSDERVMLLATEDVNSNPVSDGSPLKQADIVNVTSKIPAEHDAANGVSQCCDTKIGTPGASS